MLQPRGWRFRDDENSAVYRTDVGNEPPRECVNLVWCREAGGSQVTHNSAGPILLGWDTDCSAKEPLLPFMLGVSSKLRISAFHIKDYFSEAAFFWWESKASLTALISWSHLLHPCGMDPSPGRGI